MLLAPTRPGLHKQILSPHPAPAWCWPQQGHGVRPPHPIAGWLQRPLPPHSCPRTMGGGGITGQETPTITPRVGLQGGSGGLGAPCAGAHLPPQPGHGRGLREGGERSFGTFPVLDSVCRAAHPPASLCLEAHGPPRHSQQLNLLFQTAREPPHIAESRSRLPGARPGAPFYSHPSRRRALYPEAPHYRTGSQLVPFRIWDR